MTGFTIVALEKMLGQLGEEKCEHILSQFSCPLNKDVEEFIQSKKKIIEFSKQKIAMSYLVLASYKKSHGRPISIEDLSILKLKIDDYSDKMELRTAIQHYYGLATDYMQKNRMEFFLQTRRK